MEVKKSKKIFNLCMGKKPVIRVLTRRAMAQPGSASVWGTEGRRFKSC